MCLVLYILSNLNHTTNCTNILSEFKLKKDAQIFESFIKYAVNENILKEKSRDEYSHFCEHTNNSINLNL